MRFPSNCPVGVAASSATSHQRRKHRGSESAWREAPATLVPAVVPRRGLGLAKGLIALRDPLGQKSGMCFTTRLFVLATMLLGLMVGCHRQSASHPKGDACARIGDKVADQLLAQYPFDQLDDEVRDRIRRSWNDAGQLCLVSNRSAQACNAGDARRRDDRRCCRLESPSLHLTNIPERIEIRDQEGQDALVDLRLSGVANNRAENIRCVVPTCEDDAVEADALLHVEGTVRLAKETVKLSQDLQLEDRLTQTCTLP